MAVYIKIAIILLLISSPFFSLPTKADIPFDLTQMDDEIYREPWLTYQKLMALEANVATLSVEERLWWLLRKAQSENLLYFIDDFTQTVNQAQLLVTEKTAVEIVSLLKVFAGLVARRNVEYVKAANLFNEVLTETEQQKLTRIFVIAKQELAYTHSLTELYESSLTDLQAAYIQAFSLQDHFLIALINETYGAIYGYMNDYEKSIEYYEKALETYQHLGYRAHIGEAIFGLASTYRYWKKYDLAIEKFKLYQTKIAYNPNTQVSFLASYGLGMTLAEQGQCAEALEIINHALQLQGPADYNGELYKAKSRCLIALQQLDEAEQALIAANTIFNSLPELLGTAWQLELLKISGELAFARSEYSSSYQLLDGYYKKYIDLLIANSSSRLTNLRAVMGQERQNVELALLKQQSKVQQLQLEQQQQQQNHQRYLNLFWLMLIGLLAIIMFLQRKNNQKVLKLSITDPLSNLYNRRYVFEYLEKLFASGVSSKSELVILVFDIDDFKSLNDQYGHPFGDEVIRVVAKLGLATLRTEDIMGRIGGEEFLCILPRTDQKKGVIIAQRLLKNISRNKFITAQAQELNITVSIGLADLGTGATDGVMLYEQADQALYQSKRLGKNKVTVYTQDLPT